MKFSITSMWTMGGDPVAETYSFVRLECKKANHNKFYEIFINDNNTSANNKYIIRTLYGRIGAIGKAGINTSHSSLGEAQVAMESMVNGKLAKGYFIIQYTELKQNEKINVLGNLEKTDKKVLPKPKPDVIINSRLGLIRTWGKDSS